MMGRSTTTSTELVNASLVHTPEQAIVLCQWPQAPSGSRNTAKIASRGAFDRSRPPESANRTSLARRLLCSLTTRYHVSALLPSSWEHAFEQDSPCEQWTCSKE